MNKRTKKSSDGHAFQYLYKTSISALHLLVYAFLSHIQMHIIKCRYHIVFPLKTASEKKKCKRKMKKLLEYRKKSHMTLVICMVHI